MFYSILCTTNQDAYKSTSFSKSTYLTHCPYSTALQHIQFLHLHIPQHNLPSFHRASKIIVNTLAHSSPTLKPSHQIFLLKHRTVVLYLTVEAHATLESSKAPSLLFLHTRDIIHSTPAFLFTCLSRLPALLLFGGRSQPSDGMEYPDFFSVLYSSVQ